MNLKCNINGKEYNIVQGCTFSEEYNETLDSGTIIIDQVEMIEDLRPYDDVFIYEGTFTGYGSDVTLPNFYRHLLVDQFTEERLNLQENLYKYKIQLFSETKKLETIQLPNISITQPLNVNKKIGVYEYLTNFVNLYSPLIKVATDTTNKTWEYKQKYTLDSNLEETFKNTYSPDFSLNNPTLKDVLSQLMITKDMIPYVKDDVIYALDITERKSTFSTSNVNYIIGSRSSDNHCDNLRRNYSNALSQDNSCHMVEYLGFRNSNNALMTLENMRIETRYPIYKINKVLMCYYKKCIITDSDGNETNKIFLCKQDITKLVKLDSERNLLSQDWDDFEDTSPTSIDEMAKYKMCTVGYSIGSNYIEGWGTSYTYPDGWWDKEKTYIENIMTKIDSFKPYGIYNYGFLTQEISDTDTLTMPSTDKYVNVCSNSSLFYKSLFFIIDYDAFYSGAIVHSKDFGRDDITINDNSSSSLTLLEQDGLFQKEKINRYGNKALQINARYTSIDELQELGSVYEDDVIIYHREYNIYDNFINAIYYGTKDYVLKNYYTSVYAKHRTYNLMSYDESILRAENKKKTILLSRDKCYFEKENNFHILNDNDLPFMNLLMSFTEITEEPVTIDYFENKDKINCGCISTNSGYYLSDINQFVSGTSLCFNVRMFDNVSGGVYLKKLEPFENKSWWDTFLDNWNTESLKDDYTGTVQDWYICVDDEETGFIESMGFLFFHMNTGNLYYENGLYSDEDTIKSTIKDTIMKLPKIDENDYSIDDSGTNIMSFYKDIHKDNKEIIDMTLQLEPITDSDDIMFSQWLMKLSNLLATYDKFDEDIKITDYLGKSSDEVMIYTTFREFTTKNLYPLMILEFDKDVFNALDSSNEYSFKNIFVWSEEVDSSYEGAPNLNRCSYYSFETIRITSLSSSQIKIYGKQTVKIRIAWYKDIFTTYTDYITMTFNKVETLGNITLDSDKYCFSNLNITATLNLNPLTDTGNDFTYNGGTSLKGKFACTNDYIITQYSTSLTGYSKTESVSLFTSENVSKTYKKNMFLRLSTEKMKKTICYEEYAYGKLSGISNSRRVTNFMEVSQDSEGKFYIGIDITNFDNDIKSIQYWYLDNIIYNDDYSIDYSKASYKFVFGVNLTDKEIKQNYVKIYLSLLDNKDTRVYDSSHNVIGTIHNYVDDDTKTYDNNVQYYDDVK